MAEFSLYNQAINYRKGNKMYIVLVLKGKGAYSKADKVTPFLFTNKKEADTFAAENTKQGKYWVKCDVLVSGEEVETCDY